MKLILLFLLKKNFFKKTCNNTTRLKSVVPNFKKFLFIHPNNNITFKKKSFIENSVFFLKQKQNKKKFFFLNRFVLLFLENFFKNKVILNLKKGSNKILLKQISTSFFFNKFFKKNLKVKKQIIGVLYYSILLKDASIFSNFFKKNFEKINIKLHKKLLLGLKKIIKDLFWPIFNTVGLLGIFLNIKGKLGVSGNAKKRRYFFYFGQHSITKRTLKVSHKHNYIWTYTGSLGFGFYLFF